MRRLWREREESAHQSALSAGTVFVRDVDKASFQSAMRPVYDKFVTSPQQKALFRTIEAMR
jgi:TRAP-type C4-dicarboxylate transport system substrate-binding protein